MEKSYLSLGANLADPFANICKAVKYINNCHNINLIATSSIYETEPEEYRDQPNFLNCVICVETTLSPLDLLNEIDNIESELGRIRTFKNAPRIIDIDILLYGNQIVNLENLIIPHKKLHERLFVLEPLTELNGDIEHPVLKKKMKNIKNELNLKNGVRKTNLMVSLDG